METRGGLVLGRFCWGKMKLALQGRIEGAVQRLLEAGTGWNWLELAGAGCLDSAEQKLLPGTGPKEFST